MLWEPVKFRESATDNGDTIFPFSDPQLSRNVSSKCASMACLEALPASEQTHTCGQLLFERNCTMHIENNREEPGAADKKTINAKKFIEPRGQLEEDQ